MACTLLCALCDALRVLCALCHMAQVSAVSDDSPLHDGVIVVSVGTRYSFYCANISRTFLINPTKKQVGIGDGMIAGEILIGP